MSTHPEWVEGVQTPLDSLLREFGIKLPPGGVGFNLQNRILPVVIVDSIVPEQDAAAQLFANATGVITNVGDEVAVTVPAGEVWSIEGFSGRERAAATGSTSSLCVTKSGILLPWLKINPGVSPEDIEDNGLGVMLYPALILSGGDKVAVRRMTGVIAKTADVGVLYRLLSS